MVTPLTPAKSVSSESIKAPAVVTLAVSVTSALASMLVSFVFSASVNAFVSELFSYAVFISASLWSAVAFASTLLSLVWSASVNTFESVADSTAVLISASVWSAVAPDSIASSLVLSPFANAPSEGLGCRVDIVTPLTPAKSVNSLSINAPVAVTEAVVILASTLASV